MIRFLFLIGNSLKQNAKNFKGSGFYSVNWTEDRECEEGDKRSLGPGCVAHSLFLEDSKVWEWQARAGLGLGGEQAENCANIG